MGLEWRGAVGRWRVRTRHRVALGREVRAVRRRLASGRCAHGDSHLSCPRLAVITVAFNNPAVVLEQARRLRRHLVDDFDWYVVDNSTDRAARQPIAEAAALGGGTCVTIDRNPYRALGSPSHGFALDVAWRALVRHSARQHVALLDHDVFPIRPTSLVANIGTSALAGMLQIRDHRWYAWPGLLVVDVTRFDVDRLTFMPGGGVDTGGHVPAALRGDGGRACLREMEATEVRIRHTDGRLQSDFVMMIGDWLHLLNASGWCEVPNPVDRMAMVEALLDSFE